MLLLGCVTSKRDEAAPARDLSTSALWHRRRVAESSGKPWLVLSAEHGVVDPEQILAPHDRHLAAQTVAYQEAWGRDVVAHLRDRLGTLGDRRFELHAGAAYGDAIDEPLRREDAVLHRPLRGLTQGEHLAW